MRRPLVMTLTFKSLDYLRSIGGRPLTREQKAEYTRLLLEDVNDRVKRIRNDLYCGEET